MATTNKKTKLKEPVRIRTKKLADGSESYYLDIYADGKRSYEFLKLYRLPEINARVKEQNKATLAAVETIKSQRIIELTHNKAGLKNTSARSKMLLTDWMQTFYDDQKRRGVRGVKLLGTVSRLISTYIVNSPFPGRCRSAYRQRSALSGGSSLITKPHGEIR